MMKTVKTIGDLLVRAMRRRTATALLFGFCAIAALCAAEPDELRPGMDAEAVIGVFTMNQSCRNTVLEEGTDFFAWNAILDGRDARVEVYFRSDRALAILYRYPYLTEEEGHSLFLLLEERIAGPYGAPERGDESRLVWNVLREGITLDLFHSSLTRELVLKVGTSR